ncbi:hypothetical protein BH10BAC4_BH10BAC4_22650 [soil metagenome]
MKNLTLACVLVVLSSALLFSACGGKPAATHEHDTMTNDSTNTVYTCPMHPEETGKDGDSCSKCNMKLEKVASNDSTKMHSH